MIHFNIDHLIKYHDTDDAVCYRNIELNSYTLKVEVSDNSKIKYGRWSVNM